MATDVIPSTDSCITITNEQEKFALNINGKKVVRVEDEAAILVLNAILASLGGSSGTPFFRQASDITDGSSQTLIDETVGVGNTLTLKRVRVTCRRNVTYEILEDATVIGTGRVGAGKLNDDFVFDVDKILAAGTVLKVNIVGSGPASDVEVYLQALEN